MSDSFHSLVVILIGASPSSSRIDEREGYDQALAIAQSLHRLGYSTEIIQVTLDLTMLKKLKESRPLFIINLVEEIEGQCRLGFLAVSMLELLEVPFSGASALSYAMTTDKIWTKKLLAQAGLPTPAWSRDGLDMVGESRVIIKSVFEDASFGIDDQSVVPASQAAQALKLKAQTLGGSWFAETYLEGREFSLSLLIIDGRLKVLPVAESAYIDFPPHRPRIIDYEAKWDPASFAYNHIERKFLSSDSSLAQEMSRLAEAAWNLFDLKGYARIDFRLDDQGRPSILEINANPSLSPDSGFVAAARQNGYDYDQLISLLIPRAESPDAHAIHYRQQVQAPDVPAVRNIVAGSGFFTEEEIGVAVELLEAGLIRGDASGYQFVMAQAEGRLLGYACYGRIMGTDDRYDLYWLAVEPTQRRQGMGRKILRKVEQLIIAASGRRLYVQTAGRPFYEPTRAFYYSSGYAKVAQLAEYYGPGDDQIIFMKELDPFIAPQ